MLPKFSKTALKNGLEIYHIPVNENSGVISVNVFYKVGSRDEKMGKSGIAHMLEHLNFKSTKNKKAGEFDEIVKGYGGVNNASTGFDYTHYYIKCSKENLDKSLELYADIMQNLNLKEDEFLPERDVVAEERRWRTDNNPAGYLFYRLYNTAFIYHPYHWTPIGFKSDIANWNIDDIREFHKKFYQPQNAFIIIAGDVDDDFAIKTAKKHFKDIKNSCDISKFYTYEPPQDGEKSAILYRQSEAQMVAVAYKIPPFNHKDQVALNALSDYFGGGKSSVMQKILVDEKCLVNQIEVYNMNSKDENLFLFFAICNPDVSADEVKSEICTIVENAKKATISKDELTKAKNVVKSTFIYSLDSASKVASLYGSYIARGDLDALFDLEKNIKSLTSKEMKECLKRYFVSKNSTTIILRKDL